jgi:hypothetical protein
MPRAAGVSPEVEAGNWYLPHPGIEPWVRDFIEECAAFPNGRHDDQVDGWSQGETTCRDAYTGSWSFTACKPRSRRVRTPPVKSSNTDLEHF